MGNNLYPYQDWFDDWEKRTGNKIPDFDSLKSMADLPPLLEFSDGRSVKSQDDWYKRCTELRALLEDFFWGEFPKQIPKLDKAEILAEERERGLIRRWIELSFATEPLVSITIETMTPEGDGPFPVFLTQGNHRSWGVLGVSRGYMSCVYPGADANDQSAKFLEVYPDCSWMKIPRRAWLACRVLDYLFTLEEIDKGKIAIAGHSRNGKQSLIAAAIDKRISVVVSSSSGTGGPSPYRFTSEREFLESVENTTAMCPDWFHPRLRYFTGREQKLPVDAHAYLALIAPRHCLLSTALNDPCESTFAVERCYLAAREVYTFLGRPEALRIRWRRGRHETCAEDAQSYFDWFDRSFGRRNIDFPEKFLHYFNWKEWSTKQSNIKMPSSISTGKDQSEIRKCIKWTLGEAPTVGVEWGSIYGSEKAHDALLMRRPKTPEGIACLPIQFSDYVSGELYYPEKRKESLPVVIWLHPYSFPLGYSGDCENDYIARKLCRIYIDLAKNGYACFAFDQIGFGRRIVEGSQFYSRYPHWSKLGKMIRDVRGAVDFLLQGENRFKFGPRKHVALMPELKKDKIFCLGYSVGGMVALYATALDERIAGVASFCGFTPMRTDTDEKPTGGLRRFWEWYALLPRLGFFHGKEKELPYDFDDVLSLIAPRPCLINSPIHDRDSDLDDIKKCVSNSQKAWERKGALSAFTHQFPQNYNRFQSEQYETFLAWFQKIVAKGE